MKVLALVLCTLFIFGRVSAQLPADGVYVVLRNDLIQSIGDWMSIEVADTANTYTTAPDYSGSTSSVSYDFSSFVFDIDLGDFSYVDATAESFSLVWDSFAFIFQFNYHICLNDWPHPCENGVVQIYTTDTTVKLSAAFTLDISQPKVSFSAQSTLLQFNSNEIQIYVDCTDTFCLIPTDDIANAIAGEFVSAFQSGMVQIINTAAAPYFGQSTFVPLEMNLELDMQGGYLPVSGASNQVTVLYNNGIFRSQSYLSKNPPVPQGPAPPISAFASPAAPLTMAVTPSFFETLVWAMDLNGEFNKTITPADVPANSPVQLSTDNAFFRLSVPNLRDYPGMNITISTFLMNISKVEISPAGIVLSTELGASFNLVNSTFTLPNAFTLGIGISSTITVVISQSGNDIIAKPSAGDWVVTVDLANSKIGSVITSSFEGIIMLGLSSFFPALPSVPVPIPQIPNFVVSNPVFTLQSGYASLSATAIYDPNYPTVPCSGSSTTCPEDTTCCQWSGSYGCCTLPSASCCDVGCCPNGYSCCDGQCCGNDEVLSQQEAEQKEILKQYFKYF